MSDPRPGRHRRAKMTRKPVRQIMAPVSGQMGVTLNTRWPWTTVRLTGDEVKRWRSYWRDEDEASVPPPDKSAPE